MLPTKSGDGCCREPKENNTNQRQKTERVGNGFAGLSGGNFDHAAGGFHRLILSCSLSLTKCSLFDRICKEHYENTISSGSSPRQILDGRIAVMEIE